MARSKIVFVFFVLSGMTSLIYQVVWFRMLALVFGNTVAAMSTVLCVFFAGLAIGSFVFGRTADRFAHRLLLYGLLEGGIGVYAVLFPLLLSWMGPSYLSLYRSMGEGIPLTLIRALTSGALLLPPTILMGGTFPLIARHQVANRNEVGESISLLYFVNTMGAVVGTLLAGFLLIGWIGIRNTIWITASINIALLIGSIFLQRKTSPLPAPEIPTLAEPLANSAADKKTVLNLALIGTAISGFASLSYEVVWSRAFTSYFGSSIYSFSSIVAAFLIGIALGSFYYSRRYKSETDPLRAFGEIQLRIALSVILFLVVFMKLPAFIVWGLRSFPASFATYQTIQFVLAFLVMVYTTINLGAAFPAANAAYIDSVEKMGGKIGNVYAANTAGAILGAFASGFLLIPAIGMEKTIWICFVMNLLLGVAILMTVKSMDRTAWLWAGACALLFLLVPRWNQNVLNYGIYASAYVIAGNVQTEKDPTPTTPGTQLLQNAGFPLDPQDNRPDQTNATSADARIVFFKEGRTSTISVIEDTQGFRNLLINGKADASNKRQGDMRTQLLLGHLPMILSRKMPQSVLVIGLGSGTTLGSVERYPVKNIECVEIEPAVVEAADRFFNDVNHNALKDHRVKLIITDGRNYMAATDRRYDVITSEPSNLWMAGCSNLFTREFFQLAKNHLNPHGIVCQWIHLYQISPNDIRVFLQTFHSIFPHVSVWIDEPDMLALGSVEPIEVNAKVIASRLAVPALRAELAPSNLSKPDQFLPLFSGDTAMVQRFASGAPVNEDDRPVLEFSAPKSLLEIHSRRIIHDLLTGVPYDQ